MVVEESCTLIDLYTGVCAMASIVHFELVVTSIEQLQEGFPLNVSNVTAPYFLDA